MSQTFLQLYYVMTREGWNHISIWTHYFIFTTHKLSLSKFWQSCEKVCDISHTQKLLHIVNTSRRSNSITAKSCESVNQDIESAISLVTCKYCPIKIFTKKKIKKREELYLYMQTLFFLASLPSVDVKLTWNSKKFIHFIFLYRPCPWTKCSTSLQPQSRVITHRHRHTRCLWHTEYAWHHK